MWLNYLECRWNKPLTTSFYFFIRLVHVVWQFSSKDKKTKLRHLLMIQINDFWTLDGLTWFGDLPNFWPHGRLKGQNIENETSKNIILLSRFHGQKIPDDMNKSINEQNPIKCHNVSVYHSKILCYWNAWQL